MKDELEANIGSVLADMPVIPSDIRSRVMARLSAISEAIDGNLMQEGTMIIAFADLNDENVVLSMSVMQHYAHLNVSTADEATVISNGYDFLIGEKGVTIVVDSSLKDKILDHGSLMLAHRQTDATLEDIGRARDLMRTHPIFKSV